MRTKLHFYLYLSLFCSGIVKADTIKVGVVEFPPHIDFSENISKSKAYQYVDDILKGIYSKVVCKTYSKEQALIELDSGTIDILFPLDVSEEKLKHLSKPLFYVVPGLCFKKKDFIPVLSALHRLKELTVGVATGTQVLPDFKRTGVNLTMLTEDDTLLQAVEMLMSDRIDAFYHTSPMQVYNLNNPLFKTLACSKFYGYPSGIYLAVKNNMRDETYRMINKAFSHALDTKSYDDFYSEN